MIKHLISERYPRHIWIRYIKEISFTPSLETLYTTALGFLNKNETERVITYLIIMFESDITYEPAHHLARLILFSLSEEFVKKKGYNLKQKHKDLNRHIIALGEKSLSIERELVVLQNNFSKIENQLKEISFLESILKKKDLKNQLEEQQRKIYKLNADLVEIKKEILFTSDIAKIEEYTKLIAFLLEIVNHPKRFGINK